MAQTIEERLADVKLAFAYCLTYVRGGQIADVKEKDINAWVYSAKRAIRRDVIDLLVSLMAHDHNCGPQCQCKRIAGDLGILGIVDQHRKDRHRRG